MSRLGLTATIVPKRIAATVLHLHTVKYGFRSIETLLTPETCSEVDRDNSIALRFGRCRNCSHCTSPSWTQASNIVLEYTCSIRRAATDSNPAVGIWADIESDFVIGWIPPCNRRWVESWELCCEVGWISTKNHLFVRAHVCRTRRGARLVESQEVRRK